MGGARRADPAGAGNVQVYPERIARPRDSGCQKSKTLTGGERRPLPNTLGMVIHRWRASARPPHSVVTPLPIAQYARMFNLLHLALSSDPRTAWQRERSFAPGIATQGLCQLAAIRRIDVASNRTTGFKGDADLRCPPPVDSRGTASWWLEVVLTTPGSRSHFRAERPVRSVSCCWRMAAEPPLRDSGRLCRSGNGLVRLKLSHRQRINAYPMTAKVMSGTPSRP